MKMLTAIAFLTLAACSFAAEDPVDAKPKIDVAADGFPTGQETPEGAACDLARAFINRDDVLFSKTCIRAHSGGAAKDEYASFLKDTIKSIKEEAAKKEPSPEGPKSIGKVFAARHLSKNGPASFGYAAFGFKDIMFVDVGAFLHNGERNVNRTLVIKDKDDKWYVHPLPDAGQGLLSAGLNDESSSKKDFTEVYEIKKDTAVKEKKKE